MTSQVNVCISNVIMNLRLNPTVVYISVYNYYYLILRKCDKFDDVVVDIVDFIVEPKKRIVF